MTYLTKRNTSSSSCRCNVLIVNLDTLTTFTSTETTLLNTSSIQSSKPYLDAFMDSLIHLLTKLFDVQRNPSLLSLIKDPWEINTALIVMYGMLPTHCFHSLIHGGGSSLSKKLHAFYHLHQGKILALGPVQLQTSLFSSLLSFNPIHKEYNEDQVHRSSSSETRNSHLELQSPTLHASSNETSFLHFHVPSETETETETMESTFFNQLEGQQLFGYPIHSLLDSSSTEDVFRMEAIKQHTHAWATYASFPQQSALLEFKPSLNPSSPQGQCIFSNVLIHTSHQQRSFLHWLCHDRFRLLSSVSSSKDALVTTPSTTTTTTQPPLLLLSSQPEQLTSFLQEQLSKISDLHVESNSFSSTTYSFQDSGSTFCFHFNSISTTPLFSSLLPSTSSSSSPPPSNTTTWTCSPVPLLCPTLPF
ncbi:hypothetical protein HMI54_015808 [Coelomomyces lativittatus]|nr:hypothetical protein HMI54_015808 [Coelomomyces lativittatus]